MARKSDSCHAPCIKGERRLRNTMICRRSDSVKLGDLQAGRSFSDCSGSIRRGRRLCACFSTSLAGELVPQSLSAGHWPTTGRSGSGPVVVVQHAAQALTTLDLSRASEVAGFGTDELVSQSLMIALAVIMSNEVLNGFPQRLLAEEDHAIQA